MLAAKWQLFCSALNVLTHSVLGNWASFLLKKLKGWILQMFSNTPSWKKINFDTVIATQFCIRNDSIAVMAICKYNFETHYTE